MLVAVDLGFNLAVALGWIALFANKRHENSTVSTAWMMSWLVGFFATACFYAKDEWWAPIPITLIPFAVWTVCGYVLNRFGKTGDNAIVVSMLVGFGFLLINATDSTVVVLAVELGTFLAAAVLFLAARLVKSGAQLAGR